jgi:hypothetical protein
MTALWFWDDWRPSPWQVSGAWQVRRRALAWEATWINGELVEERRPRARHRCSTS